MPIRVIFVLRIIITRDILEAVTIQPGEMSMFVCVCNKVTDGQIREACKKGASTMDCLKSQLKVATCCGRCQDCAKQLLRESQANLCRDQLSLATA